MKRRSGRGAGFPGNVDDVIDRISKTTLRFIDINGNKDIINWKYEICQKIYVKMRIKVTR